MKRLFLFPFLIVLFLSGCKHEAEEKCAFIPDTKDIQIKLVVESLEDSLPAMTKKKQFVHFLTRHPFLRDHYFSRQNYPGDSVFINTLFKRFTHPSFDTLVMETHRVFGDGSQLANEFKQAFTNLRYYYPDFRIPKIQTMVSGFLPGADLVVNDSVIVVGLDYYLGKGAKYRPDMYAYMLRRYYPGYVVPSVLLLYGIDPAFNKTSLGDRTVLADMVSFGKAYYFAKHMIPCFPDSSLIGYTSEEIIGSKSNEDQIYARLIENEVLYSTSHQVKQRYIEERPKTLEIGEKCPGRIGQWVGWQIVKSYGAKFPDKTLPDVMKVADAEKLFKESKYKPERK